MSAAGEVKLAARQVLVLLKLLPPIFPQPTHLPHTEQPEIENTTHTMLTSYRKTMLSQKKSLIDVRVPKM